MTKLEKYFRTIMREKNPYISGFVNEVDVFGSFSGIFDPKTHVVIYANYEYEDYSGYATVFFYDRKAKKFYENYGSHCSCYELEDQWDPEEILFEELGKRIERRTIGSGAMEPFYSAYADFLKGK